MAVPVDLSPAFHAGPPSLLFATHAGAAGASFDATPDGQTFLVSSALSDQGSPPLNLVVHWKGLVRKE
jgi:hypothetical protein